KIKNWNPFDDSMSSNFFSPNWMFGIDERFDIVLGNPPYIGEKGHESIFQLLAKTSLGKRTYTRWMDYFYFFFHSGIDYLKDNGCLIFISTNYYFTSTGGKILRADLKNRTTIASLINFIGIGG
ncbi:MAG: Eco57I restriction-modification methylase domain-containing protein, partial [Bacteroidia bacterium]|nr:Eco57I restriction-modification methylase domain-containing protein [Bacteroidia bacterium]